MMSKVPVFDNDIDQFICVNDDFNKATQNNSIQQMES